MSSVLTGPTIGEILYEIPLYFWMSLVFYIIVVVGYTMTAKDSSREPENEGLTNAKNRQLGALILGSIYLLAAMFRLGLLQNLAFAIGIYRPQYIYDQYTKYFNSIKTKV
jgi:hypothetical protein